MAGTALPLQPQCQFCGREKTNLLQCAGCKVVFYCSRDHKTSHREQHEAECTLVKKARAKMNRYEAKLRREETCFEFDVGRFWGCHETRPYMRARHEVVDALMRIKTREAVQAAADHLDDMLRLNRSDNMGVRSIVPALYLRLDRDQDAYDFIKWWSITGNDMYYNWGDTRLPYLNIHGADVFEPVERCIPCHDLGHDVALTLIKIRLLLDLRTVKAAGSVGQVSQETFDNIRGEMLSSVSRDILDNIRGDKLNSVVAGKADLRREFSAGRSKDDRIADLEAHVRKLFEAVKKANKHFWPALLSPGDDLNARPAFYGHGDEEEMQIMLQSSYDSWLETPGAIDIVRELVQEATHTERAEDSGRT